MKGANMASKTKAAAKATPPLAHLLDKDITPTMDRYAKWLTDQTGYEVDPISVQLAGSQRGQFQKSDLNQQALEANRKAREEAIKAREERKAERAEAAAAKAAAKAEGKSTTKRGSTKAEPAPTKGKAATPAKPGPTRRRPAAKKSDF